MIYWYLEELKRIHERSKKMTLDQNHLSYEVLNRHVSQLVSAAFAQLLEALFCEIEALSWKRCKAHSELSECERIHWETWLILYEMKTRMIEEERATKKTLRALLYARSKD